MNAVDPIVITTTDGQERKLLLTRGSLKRIRQALKCNTIQDILSKVATDENGSQAVFFYEALVDRSVSLEQFEDVMPVSLENDMKLIFDLIGAAVPKADGDRPPVPLTTIQ